MHSKCFRLIALWLFLAVASVAVADQTEVDGVFGLAPIPEYAALAVWVPLEDGESVSGVMWYNNDGSIAFPELLAVAGDPGLPPMMDSAVVVVENLVGESLDWSEHTFIQALATETDGLFLVFRLPLDGAFEHEGTGCGLGYGLGDGQIRCWIGSEEDEWDLLSPEFQMAVQPIMGAAKSGDILVLRRNSSETLASESASEQVVPLVESLSASPNPFNPQTNIRFVIPSGGDVALRVFDIRGYLVRTLVSGSLKAGAHTVTWNGCDSRGRPQASGVYLMLLESGTVRLTQRLMLLQ